MTDKKRQKVLFFVFNLFFQLVTGDHSIVVSLHNGKLRGNHFYDSDGSNYVAFKGIQYAEAPVGSLRFKDSVPVKAWNNTRDATRFGSACPNSHGSNSDQNENCLFLNVYTPNVPSQNPSSKSKCQGRKSLYNEIKSFRIRLNALKTDSNNQTSHQSIHPNLNVSDDCAKKLDNYIHNSNYWKGKSTQKCNCPNTADEFLETFCSNVNQEINEESDVDSDNKICETLRDSSHFFRFINEFVFDDNVTIKDLSENLTCKWNDNIVIDDDQKEINEKVLFQKFFERLSFVENFQRLKSIFATSWYNLVNLNDTSDIDTENFWLNLINKFQKANKLNANDIKQFRKNYFKTISIKKSSAKEGGLKYIGNSKNFWNQFLQKYSVSPLYKAGHHYKTLTVGLYNFIENNLNNANQTLITEFKENEITNAVRYFWKGFIKKLETNQIVLSKDITNGFESFLKGRLQEIFKTVKLIKEEESKTEVNKMINNDLKQNVTNVKDKLALMLSEYYNDDIDYEEHENNDYYCMCNKKVKILTPKEHILKIVSNLKKPLNDIRVSNIVETTSQTTTSTRTPTTTARAPIPTTTRTPATTARAPVPTTTRTPVTTARAPVPTTTRTPVTTARAPEPTTTRSPATTARAPVPTTTRTPVTSARAPVPTTTRSPATTARAPVPTTTRTPATTARAPVPTTTRSPATTARAPVPTTTRTPATTARAPIPTTTRSPATTARAPIPTTTRTPATTARAPVPTTTRTPATTARAPVPTTTRTPATTARAPVPTTTRSPATTARAPATTARAPVPTTTRTPVTTARAPVPTTTRTPVTTARAPVPTTTRTPATTARAPVPTTTRTPATTARAPVPTTTRTPVTTARAPVPTTTRSPATTARAPVPTTTRTPVTTARAPVPTTTRSPATTARAPVPTTTRTPATTARAPKPTTTRSPATTARAPVPTTTRTPATTARAPVPTTTRSPATTARAPATTARAPVPTTTRSPATTARAPATTARAPVPTTTRSPATTARAPVPTTTRSPATTARAPATTARAPVPTTTRSPATTARAPVPTTTRTPATTARAPVPTTTRTPATTARAPVPTTTRSPATTARAPATTARAPVPTTTRSPATTARAPVPTTTRTPATTARAPVPTTTRTPVTTARAPVPTTTRSPATTARAPVPTTTRTPATTARAPVPTTTRTPATTARAPVPTTTRSPATTARAPVTTARAPVPTTTRSPATTARAPVPTTTRTPATTARAPVPTTTRTPATTARAPVPTTTRTPATTARAPVPTTTRTPATTARVPVPTTTRTPATTARAPVPTTTRTPTTTARAPIPTTTRTPTTTTRSPTTTTSRITTSTTRRILHLTNPVFGDTYPITNETTTNSTESRTTTTTEISKTTTKTAATKTSSLSITKHHRKPCHKVKPCRKCSCKNKCKPISSPYSLINFLNNVSDCPLKIKGDVKFNFEIKSQCSKCTNKRRRRPQKTPRSFNICDDLSPVMVYMHDKDKTDGSTFNPAPLVRKGVVVVTLEYRNGLLGSMELNGGSLNPSNLGLRDQVLALKWVQDNIADLGGNPNDVTLFGDGAIISLHIASPLSRNLFHKTILMDASLLSPNVFADVFQSRKESVKSALSGVTDLQNASFDTLQKLTKHIPFGPIIESSEQSNAFLTRETLASLHKCSSNYNDGPQLVGFSSAPGFYGALSKSELSSSVPKNDSDLNFLLSGNSLNDVFNRNVSSVIIKRVKDFYFPNLALNNANDFQNYLKILGDIRTTIPILSDVYTRFKTSSYPTYLFKFDVNGKNNYYRNTYEISNDDYSGATSDDILGYLFHFDSHPAIIKGSVEYSTRDFLTTLWTNFAKTGYPNSANDTSPVWKPITNSSLNGMLVSNEAHNANYSFANEIKSWVFWSKELLKDLF